MTISKNDCWITFFEEKGEATAWVPSANLLPFELTVIAAMFTTYFVRNGLDDPIPGSHDVILSVFVTTS